VTINDEAVEFILGRCNEMVSDIQKEAFNVSTYGGALNAMMGLDYDDKDRKIKALCLLMLESLLTMRMSVRNLTGGLELIINKEGDPENGTGTD